MCKLSSSPLSSSSCVSCLRTACCFKFYSFCASCIQENLLTVVKVYHFKLPGFCHLVTAVYPSITRDGEMIDDNELGKCFTPEARLSSHCFERVLHCYTKICC